MQFLSLEPFVPSGKDFEKSRLFFLALGFSITWEAPGYAGFQRQDCKFTLQKFDNPEFAENFMLTVKVDNVAELRSHVINNMLVEKFGIRIGELTHQPYGKEVNIIDLAGVCWHFVE